MFLSPRICNKRTRRDSGPKCAVSHIFFFFSFITLAISKGVQVARRAHKLSLHLYTTIVRCVAAEHRLANHKKIVPPQKKTPPKPRKKNKKIHLLHHTSRSAREEGRFSSASCSSKEEPPISKRREGSSKAERNTYDWMGGPPLTRTSTCFRIR